MRRYLSVALAGVGALLISACASSALTGAQEWEGTYAAGFEKVQRVAAEEVRRLGMGMESGAGANGDVYFIQAYKERRLQTDFQGQDNNVRAMSLRVRIERLGAERTHVRIEVPSRGGSYGSVRDESHYGARRYAEALLRQLNARL